MRGMVCFLRGWYRLPIVNAGEQSEVADVAPSIRASWRRPRAARWGEAFFTPRWRLALPFETCALDERQGPRRGLTRDAALVEAIAQADLTGAERIALEDATGLSDHPGPRPAHAHVAFVVAGAPFRTTAISEAIVAVVVEALRLAAFRRTTVGLGRRLDDLELVGFEGSPILGHPVSLRRASAKDDGGAEDEPPQHSPRA